MTLRFLEPNDAEVVETPEGPKAAVWTWPKVATWLREKQLDHFENRRVLKTLSTTYTKGTKTVSGRVRPLEIVDGLQVDD
jgi:hypothetical protein